MLTPLNKPFEVSPSVMTMFAVAALIVRIPWLHQPFVDAWAWRQSDVAMVARNFYEGGFNLFFPQINYGGTAPGYVGTEFPLVPFLAALEYLVFNEQEWIGRSVSLLFFVISLPSFYRLCRRTWNDRAAKFAIIFYLYAPLTLTASVSFTSDMTACSLAVIALERFASWLDDPRDRRIFAAATFVTTLSLLVKIPYMLFGLPMLYMAWETWGFSLFRQLKLWTFASVTLLVSGAWYLHAYMVSVNHFPHFMFGEGTLRFVELPVYRDILLQTLFWGSAQSSTSVSSLTPVLTGLMVVGLLLRPRARYGWTFHWLLLAELVFTVFAGVGSRFPAYQLPVAVVAAALGGRTCDCVLQFTEKRGFSLIVNVAIVGLILGAFFWVSYESTRRFYYPWAMPYMNTGAEVDEITPKEALILFATDLEPTTVYYSKRKGWLFDAEPGSFIPAYGDDAIRTIEIYRNLGSDYLVVPVFHRSLLEYKKFHRYLETHYRLLEETDDYTIYDLARNVEGEAVGETRTGP